MINRKRAARCALYALAAWTANYQPALADVPIQTWQTAGGARVLFVEARDLPMLDVAVELPAGSSRDSSTKPGVASLTLRLLQLGTAAMNEDRISEKLADTGAELSARFDVDRAGYALRTLSSSSERDESLAMLRSILQSPSFPEAVLEREKARTIAALRDAQTRPAAIAEREFRRLVLGNHPYGLPPYGDPETVATITRDDLKQFHSKFYLAREAVVAIIGDVSRREAERVAEMLTAGLPNSGRRAAALPPVTPLAKSVERVIAHPATQAYIRMGMPGMRRGDTDYFALWLGNHVLGGGGFSSRLTIELREKRGLTYSASSYFSPFAQPGPYVLELQTRKDQAWEALEVLRQTFEKFVAEGPSEQELEAAKQNVIGGFVLRIDSNGKILEYLSLIGFYRLPLDYIDRFPERISALTLTEVRDAFRRRVDPARMITVVVGPENKP